MSSLPLRHFPAVHTTSVDEASALFGRLTTPARFHSVSRDEPFEWKSNVLSVGAVKFTANQFGAGFGVSNGVIDFFSTAFALCDVPSSGFDGDTPVPLVKDQRTWFVSPHRASGFQVGSGLRSLAVTFSRADAEAALASLLGDVALTAPLEFETHLSLTSGAGAWLYRYTRFIAAEADQHATPFASPIVRARLADTIIYGLLEGHGHNYSARLAAGRTAEPKYVSDAADYLAAHAAEPVQLADLARVTGLGVRALQLGFHKHRGCTPMEFLKERRLQLARTVLLDDSTKTVSQIALDCGFGHVGRFSTLYRARFGERPNETLARGRALSARKRRQ